MGSALLRNASDSYVSEKYPNKNYSNVSRLFLADGSSADTRFGYIYFGVPSGLDGATVTSAKLRLYSGSDPGWTGSRTLTIQRLASRFTVTRVNWNNKPGVTGASKSLTKSDAKWGTLWEFDVTDILQQVANGASWYGFRISATGANAKFLFSAQAGNADFRPQLEINWSDAPETPDQLRPDNGVAVSVAKPTLQWDFVDTRGDTTMQSYNLRLFSTEALANANGPGDLLDTTVNDSVPQLDLDSTTYAGIAVGSTVWWRVQVIDGAGLPSGWSDPAYFTRTDKGVLTITNPAAAPNDFVSEPTPPFSWTFTGKTQQAYEVLLSTPAAPAKYLWRSGIVTSADTAVTPPAGKIVTNGSIYRLTVRIYDTVSRASLPDDKPYVEAVRDFTFQFDATVDPVTGFTGTKSAFYPQMTLEWDRATAPDSFVILRNNVVVDEVYPSDVLVSGTHYRYVDGSAKPRKQQTWKVAAKVNGKTSSANPSVVDTVQPIAPTLSNVDNSNTIFLFNPDAQAAKAESSDVHYILGQAPPVLITQSLRGYEGTMAGVLLSNTVPGLSADDQLDYLQGFKNAPGQVLKLVWVNKVMKVVIYDVTDTPIANADGSVEYLVSFAFFQVDF